jgi:adenylate cyclase
MARRLAAIVFTDLAGYTELTQRNEGAALQLLQAQDRLVRPVLELHHGRKVKSMGDGLLLEFSNALDAVEGAVDLQRRANEHNTAEGSSPLRLRIGIHLGDVQRRGTDILGDSVNIASRIEPLATEGGVCLSGQVFDQVQNKVPYRFEKIGARTLQGVREAVELYRVVLPWLSDGGSPGGPVLPRLAVLPLANISPDPHDEYLADGLTEELISALAQVRGLRVISRTSVNQYKGTTKPITQIGSELGADSVLEGSVRKAGDQLRISVQLIDTRTDEHRWAQTFDRKLENVFAIQAEVAERTAGALQVELLESERGVLHERPTQSLAAYESYLRGVKAARSESMSAAEDREACEYFEAAIREDPRFSAAYSHYANHLILVSGAVRPAREAFPRARELVATALQLNPQSSDAHTARGNLAMQSELDWPLAEVELQRAIALNPSNSAAHSWYGLLLVVLQRFDEAEKQLRAAIELDPLWNSPRYQQVFAHSYSGDALGALSLAEKMKVAPASSASFLSWLAWLSFDAGHQDRALELLRPLAGTADLTARSNRAEILARLGQPEELRRLLEEWEAGKSEGYVPASSVAADYAFLGERERALDLLEKDFREGDKGLWIIYQAVAFDSLRDEPRFKELLRAMNLPPTLTRPLRRAEGSGKPGP